MLKLRKDIHVPVLCTLNKDMSCDIVVPDLQITVHGKDYIEALSNAMFYVSSIYYYNKERYHDIAFSYLYSEVEDMCSKYSQNTIATVINLTEM